MKAARIAVYHTDCFASVSTERFPEIQLEQASPMALISEDAQKVRYKLLWKVHAPDARELDLYLNHLKEMPHMVAFDVLRRGYRTALILPTVDGPSSSYDRVVSRGTVYAEPVIVQGGYEVHAVVSENPGHLKRLLEELDALGEVKLKSVTQLDANNPHGFTEKQAQALDAALTHKYYSWPRKVTLEQIAQRLKTTRRAFQENLRKAESKCLPEILKDVLSKK